MSQSPANPASAEELAAALPAILAAPRDAGEIRLLCARPRPNARRFPDRLVMTRAGGVAGDFEMSRPWLTLPDGAPDPRIQVAVIAWQVLDLVWRERDRIPHPGDTLTVDMCLTEENLPSGTLLSAGSAVLRVSDVPNDGCVKWKVRYGKAAQDWAGAAAHAPLRLRGLFCSIERDGEIGLGDRLRRL